MSATGSELLSPMGQAALQYARRGWKVFPVRERDGEPYRTANGTEKQPKAKQPYIGNGFKNATTDERQIRDWWRRWPQAMIGFAIGESGYFALDFDPRVDEETGEVFELKGLKAGTEAQIGCELPISLASRTQSDGVHVIYRQPRDGEPIRNRGNLPRHVDVRGQGGYIILPPSTLYREDGGEGRYRWIEGRRDTDPVEAPAPLIAVLRERKQAASKDIGGGPPPATDPPLPRKVAAANPSAISETVRKYALSALDSECRELASTPIGGGRWGGRNQGIYHAALKMGGLVAAGAIGESVVRAAIQGVIDGMPANDDPAGAAQTLANGLRDGQANPRDLREIEAAAAARGSRARRSSGASRLRDPDPDTGRDRQSFRMEGSDAGSGGQGPGDDGGETEEIMRRCLFRPHTDLGNAERFLERHGRDFRWSPALGWLGWDGRRWAVLDDDAADKNSVPAEVMEAIYRTVRAIQDEGEYVAMSGGKEPARALDEFDHPPVQLMKQWALHIETGRPDDGLDYVSEARGNPLWSDIIRKWGRTTEAAGKISAIAKLARPKLAVRVGQLDADPLAINVLNGTLRFRKRMVDGKIKAEYRLFPHERDDLITKLAPVLFDPSATCPIYDDLISWAQPKAEMRRYLHAWGGYSMTGDTSEQKLQCWYGLGGNGKSTVIDAWSSAYGDYADTIGIESFLDQGIKKRGDQASPDLAKLAGCRLLRSSEPEGNSRFAVGLIKLVTGGEPVPVRHLNRSFFNMKVMFKLTISFNEKPDIKETNDGIWRRVKLVGWGQRVRDEINPSGTRDKDPDLPKKLLGELSGIFNRLVDGLIDWLEHGLIEPEDVIRDTLQYRTENDPLARFLRLCTVPDAESTARSSKLHELFVAWCRVADEVEWKQKGFSNAMLAKGYQKKASDGMHWLGMRMIREPSDFIDEHGRAKAFSLPDDDDAASPRTPDPAADEGLERWDDPDYGLEPP